MIQKLVPSVACLIAVCFWSLGAPAQNAPLRATHVLGLEGIANNGAGNLSIQEDALRFQRDDGSAAQIRIGSIRDVSLGAQDKEVGGTPMAVGRTAAPFGGGRVVGLFAHKKYDTLTVEYLDANGGFHGAIFLLNKGQAQVIRNELAAEGAHVNKLEAESAWQGTAETKNESK